MNNPTLSPCIILFPTRYDKSINDWHETTIFTRWPSVSLVRFMIDLLTSQSIADDVTNAFCNTHYKILTHARTRKAMSNSLDVDLIHGYIYVQLCKWRSYECKYFSVLLEKGTKLFYAINTISVDVKTIRKSFFERFFYLQICLPSTTLTFVILLSD